MYEFAGYFFILFLLLDLLKEELGSGNFGKVYKVGSQQIKKWQ
jgi:hypothetical protein